MIELSRTIDEVILLYQVEPETKDIYVEGITDKLLIERFLKKNKVYDVRVSEVHELNFNSYYHQYPNIKSNNREKLIAFNDILEKNLETDLDCVTIIIDKDYDGISSVMQTGKYILYTDYFSIELYLFNPEVLDIFIRHTLRTFPISGQKTIELLTQTLLDKSSVRMAVYKLGGVDISHFTPFSKSIIVEKEKMKIQFVPRDHIMKILNNSKRMSELQMCIQYSVDFRETMVGDPRIFIRGHDFVDLFFLVVNKVKSGLGFTSETFERSLFQSIDYSELKTEKLFSDLLNKYSA